MPGMIRPRRVFWNRVAIAFGIPVVALVIFVLPVSAMWTSGKAAGAGYGSCELGVLKGITVQFQSPAPTEFWSSSVTNRQVTIRWSRIAWSGVIFAGAIGAMVLGMRWDIRRGRLKGRCDECGFDLTGLHEPRCPECGTAFAGSAKT